MSFLPKETMDIQDPPAPMDIQDMLAHYLVYDYLKRNSFNDIAHSGPENSKKSKKTREIKYINLFNREIAFLAILNFFPVQKLIFGYF